MNIQQLKSVVDKKQEEHAATRELQELRDIALRSHVCPDCGGHVKSVRAGWLVVLLSAEKLKCSECGKVHTIYYEPEC